ncbi:RNA-binding domain-containing protein, partial [Martensiomyces pterosporus]
MSQLESLFDEFNQEEQQPSVPAQAKTEAGAAQPSETYTKSMLFVRGIPKDATNEELEEFFSNVGPIRSCFVATVRNRGFGFVQFVLAEDAARAIDELANVKFRDQKHLMLDFAMKKLTRDGEDTSQPPRAKRPRPESQKSKEDSRPEKKPKYIDKNARIIVRNLPFKVRERELEHIFSESGTVLKVDLPRKYVGGPLRGFAFIQMGDYESAERAIARWDEHKLEGRAVSVSFAIAKDKFKEMEEKGEIVRPEFASDAEASEGGNEDAAMDSEGEGEDELGDEKAAMDEDGEKEVGEDSEEGDDDEDIVDESLQQGCTLFIRNLSFDSDEDGLFEHFRAFGKLRYCRIVFDPETGRSRGTAFVCFWNPSDAAKCLEAAEKAQALSDKLGSSTSAAVADTRNKSVLLQEAPASLDATSQFTLDGRLLSVSKAVDRNTATDLATEGLQKRKSKDKRNLYLLKEGIIFPDSPAATAMAPPDLEQHSKEYGVRKNQLLKNPNLYLSKTRLSVHNIPRPVDDAALRSAAMSAVSKFKQEVKDKKRQPLSQDEMAEGWDKRPSIVQAKIVRSTDRIDVNTGKPRSMGYGFIEFKTHAHALACLRYLN